MTDNERLQAIRAELKANGYSSRRVGVAIKYSGYSSSIRVTIKDREIDKAEIERIARKYRDVDYDEATGEILAGGNTYVFVKYDYRLALA